MLYELILCLLKEKNISLTFYAWDWSLVYNFESSLLKLLLFMYYIEDVGFWQWEDWSRWVYIFPSWWDPQKKNKEVLQKRLWI